MGADRVECPRCGGKKEVTCLACKGTGDARNDSWVVIGPCKVCAQSKRKGFVTCPKCGGTGFTTATKETPTPDTKKW